MGKHQWDKEKYSVNVKVLDEQHLNLFTIINELDDGIQKKSSVKIQELLNKLHEYTLLHFSTEEQLLQKSNYPDLDKHKEEHASFIEKIARFSEEFNINNEDVSKQLSDYLFYWLFFHIQCDDQDYSEFLINKGEN